MRSESEFLKCKKIAFLKNTYFLRWHLGSCNIKYTPAARGFDSFYGYFMGQSDYYTHRSQGSFIDLNIKNYEKKLSK